MRSPSYNISQPENPSFEWRTVEEYPLGFFETRDGDGAKTWYLYVGYEDLKLFEFQLASGNRELVLGYIDDQGTVCWADSGDDCGWQWDSVSRWSHIPK